MGIRLAKIFVIAVSVAAVTVGIYSIGLQTIGIVATDVHKRFSPIMKNPAKNASGRKPRDLPKLMPNYDNIKFVHKNFALKENIICGSLADILRRGAIVICALRNEYNPFFQMRTKKGYVGKDIRLASELGKALGTKVIYQMVYESYADVVNAIHNGEGDAGIAKLPYTPERARNVVYSAPYVISRKIVLLNRSATFDVDNRTLDKILNNPETKIAVMQNTSYESFMRSLFPNAQISSEMDWENGAIKKLKSGEIIAVSRDELRIKALMKKYPILLLNFMPLMLKNTIDSISVVTNPKEHSLNLYINKFLENDYRVLSIPEMLDIYKDYIK